MRKRMTAGILLALAMTSNVSAAEIPHFDTAVFRAAGEKISYALDRRLESDIIDKTNEMRAENGLGMLVYDSDLSAAALAHAKNMYENSFFTHASDNGESFGTRVNKYTGGKYTMIAENIANGRLDADGVVNLWMNSPGHRANILNENYKHIGVGYCGEYFVMDFGN